LHFAPSFWSAAVLKEIETQMIALFGIEINWWHGVRDLITITVAYMLAVPIGWHRLRAERGFGLRTYPLVAIASCTFLLIGEAMPGTAKADPRLIQGLMTGIVSWCWGHLKKRRKGPRHRYRSKHLEHGRNGCRGCLP
jgi:hypothetical protein